MSAPVASGWSGCRVGLAPTGKRRLVTAHVDSGNSHRFLRDLAPDCYGDTRTPSGVISPTKDSVRIVTAERPEADPSRTLRRQLNIQRPVSTLR
jgi:hypothetical protein